MVNPDALGYGLAFAVGGPLTLAYGTTAVRYAVVDGGARRETKTGRTFRVLHLWRGLLNAASNCLCRFSFTRRN